MYIQKQFPLNPPLISLHYPLALLQLMYKDLCFSTLSPYLGCNLSISPLPMARHSPFAPPRAIIYTVHEIYPILQSHPSRDIHIQPVTHEEPPYCTISFSLLYSHSALPRYIVRDAISVMPYPSSTIPIVRTVSRMYLPANIFIARHSETPMQTISILSILASFIIALYIFSFRSPATYRFRSIPWQLPPRF